MRSTQVLFLACFCLIQFHCKTTKNLPADQDGITLYVAAQRVDCMGVGPQTCFQIRQSPTEDWTLYYTEIEGFDYQPGYEYQLLVEKMSIANPPADASGLKYLLKKVISKTRPAWMGLHDIWVLESLNGKTIAVTERPRLELYPGEGKVNGFAGCNQFFGKMMAGGSDIHFSGLGSTKMFCDGKMELETQFLAGLETADHYVIKNLQLILLEGDRETMVLKKVD